MLMSVLLSGGIVAIGLKLYSTKQPKKKPPFIMNLRQTKKKYTPFSNGKSTLPLVNLEKVDNLAIYAQQKKKIKRFKHEKLALFSTRCQHLKEINGNSELSAEGRRRNQNLIIASINLGLAGISLFYSPLIWLTIPGLIYNYISSYQLAIKAIFEERRVSAYVLDTVLISGMILGGYFYAAVIDALFLAVGRVLLFKSENNSKRKLMDLFSDQPRLVWIIVDDGLELEIPFETLQLGDIIIVHAGQTIPVDGVITSGFASIDQHNLTGESQPAEKGVGEMGLASTFILAGRITIRTERTGQETVARQIGVTLNQTTDFKNLIQSRGEAIADKVVLPTLGMSFLSLPFLGVSSALALLCNIVGYKMRIFAPLSMLTFLNIASQQGILIKDGRSLDSLNQVDTIVFDKTGTLTLEQPTIGKIYACKGNCPLEVLKYAAAAEAGQTHPIAKAILAAAKARKIEWPNKILNAKYKAGYGIQVDLSERIIRVGSHKFMALEDIPIPAEISLAQEDCHQLGSSLIMVACDEKLVGAIELQATIRPEAKRVIEDLHQRNMSIYIISGDQEAPTKNLAQRLGVDHYFANILPEKKADLVEQLQKEGRIVCFVGDGINDTIALKKANVSVSLSGATTIALDTAQIVLMDGTLNQLGETLDIVQDFELNMKNNLLLSALPSVFYIAGVVFFQWGVFIGVIISSSVMFTGLGNATWPLLVNYKQQGELTAPLEIPR